MEGKFKFGRFGASASLAYSKDQTSQAASKTQSERSGTLYVVEGKCYVSKLQLEKVNLHPDFLSDLFSFYNNDTFMDQIVKKYGTFYYKHAIMGGVLKMASSTSKTVSSSQTTQNLQTATSMSFGAKVSGYGANVGGSAAFSSDNSASSEVQQSYESASTHSSILTYGGAPSAFGGAGDTASTTWEEWASSIDLLPVPVDYQLERVSLSHCCSQKIKDISSAHI